MVKRGIQSAPYFTWSSGSLVMVYESIRPTQGWNSYWRSCISLPVDVARPNSDNEWARHTDALCPNLEPTIFSLHSLFKRLPGCEPTNTEPNITAEEENSCP